MTQNGHDYAICCQKEVAGDVVSCGNVKTIESYLALNFEVDSSSSFRDFSKRSFCDGAVGGGSGSVNAICSRL